jgi:hypothetical protein
VKKTGQPRQGEGKPFRFRFISFTRIRCRARERTGTLQSPENKALEASSLFIRAADGNDLPPLERFPLG